MVLANKFWLGDAVLGLVLDLSIDIVLSETYGDALAHSWQCCYVLLLRFLGHDFLKLCLLYFSTGLKESPNEEKSSKDRSIDHHD